jgi:hypothetical protein
MTYTVFDADTGSQHISGVSEKVAKGFIEIEVDSLADIRVEDQNGAEPHWSLTPRQKAEREADRIKRLSRQHQHRPR